MEKELIMKIIEIRIVTKLNAIWKNGEPKEGTTLEKPHTSEGKDWVKYQGQWVSTVKDDWGLPMKNEGKEFIKMEQN